MDAMDLLRELEITGISVTVVGDRLRVVPASRLTPPHREALRGARQDVIDLLGRLGAHMHDLEWFDERAAIMEFDGGLTRTDAEAAAMRCGRIR